MSKPNGMATTYSTLCAAARHDSDNHERVQVTFVLFRKHKLNFRSPEQPDSTVAVRGPVVEFQTGDHHTFTT